MNIQLVYSSKLTTDSPTYYRGCQIPKCHYETLELYVITKGVYVLWSESNINTVGYIYNKLGFCIHYNGFHYDALLPFEDNPQQFVPHFDLITMTL